MAKKAVELYDYNKHIDLPQEVLDQLVSAARDTISDFKDLMADMEEDHLLGTLDPLLLDHMIREEFYYLYKMGVEGIDPGDFIRGWNS